MGVIDVSCYTLTCKQCGTTESSRILDKGSMYGWSVWGERANFNKFETEWKGGGQDEPELLSKKCKQCGSTDIEVENHYELCVVV